MKKHIPNGITLLNLACGTTGIVLSLEGQWQWGVYLILVAAIFDFLDGLAARMLGAYSESGKQLDSLADMLSFGTLPAIFLYNIFRQQFSAELTVTLAMQGVILISVLIIPVFSAIRLARFNLGKGSTAFFDGLPTPAHALFWTGLYWQYMQSGLLFGTPLNIYFIWAIMWVMAFYMILPLPMYSLKFEHFRLKENLLRYLLLFISLIILIFTGLAGLTLIVLTYILLSLLNLLLQMRVSK